MVAKGIGDDGTIGFEFCYWLEGGLGEYDSYMWLTCGSC